MSKEFDEFMDSVNEHKEEPTFLEEAKQRAKNYMSLKGALEPKTKKYSEEEVLELLLKALTHKDNGETGNLITAQGEIRTANFYSWFEQNKKK